MGEKFLSIRNCVLISASFIINMTVLGTARLATLMFVATIRRYETGRKQASLPFLLAGTMRCITGPLVGYLGSKFGSEIVTVCGCVMSAIGVGTCFLAENVIGVTISWGIVYGIGIGLGTSLLPEILCKYFTDHVDKANGMILAGECFGAILFPSVTFVLLKTYGTSGTFLILSGIILHSVPAAMVLVIFKHKEIPPLTPKSIRGDPVDVDTKDTLLAVNPSLKPLKIPSDKTQGMYSELSRHDPLETNSLTMHPIPCQTINVIEVCDEKSMGPPIKERTKVKPFRVFVDPTFLLIVFIQSSMQFALTTIFTTCIDFFKDIGVTEHEEVYLLMGFAVSDTIGRFFFGSFTDAGFMRKINFYILCQGLVGSIVASYVLLNGFITTMLASCTTGLFAGGMMMISPGIVALYIEKDDVMMAMASRYSLYPLMSITQPFLIEYFREDHGSYNGLFLLISGLSFTCGLLSLLIPVTARHRKNKLLSSSAKLVRYQPSLGERKEER